jgi:acyl dehydratase
MRSFVDVDALESAVGEHLGHSDWRTIDQVQVAAFAEVTGDRQWIHVDAGRAADGPFGGAVVHGYLLLALIPVFMAEVFAVDQVRAVVNVGLRAVQFRRPVPVGSRVRAGVRLASVERGADHVDTVTEIGVECQGRGGFSCVAHNVCRFYR